MTGRRDSTVERLRRAFAADDRGPVAGESCPEPGEIWDAVHACAEPERARELVHHIARCPACAAEWRLAMRDWPAGATRTEPVERQRFARAWRRAKLAGLAAMLAGVGWILYSGVLERDAPGPPAYRGPATLELRSSLPEDAVLPRARAELRWTAVGEGASYAVDVLSEDLHPLVSAPGLAQNRYTIPAHALGELPPGSRIVWRVRAELPDGRELASAAFFQRIE